SDHHLNVPDGDNRVSSSGMCTSPPPERNGHSSTTDASNAGLATCVPRSPASRPKHSRYQSTRFDSPACGTSTPFGLPVDPDVYTTYARLDGESSTRGLHPSSPATDPQSASSRST